jgi:hypothetical protein
MNVILICYYHPQGFEFCHIFKRFIMYLCILVLGNTNRISAIAFILICITEVNTSNIPDVRFVFRRMSLHDNFSYPLTLSRHPECRFLDVAQVTKLPIISGSLEAWRIQIFCSERVEFLIWNPINKLYVCPSFDSVTHIMR